MNVQVPIRLDLTRDDYLSRREVVRALADERRTMEDDRGELTNFIDDPRAGMLISLARHLDLDPLQTIEALGAELVSERLWIRAPENEETWFVQLESIR